MDQQRRLPTLHSGQSSVCVGCCSTDGPAVEAAHSSLWSVFCVCGLLFTVFCVWVGVQLMDQQRRLPTLHSGQSSVCGLVFNWWTSSGGCPLFTLVTAANVVTQTTVPSTSLFVVFLRSCLLRNLNTSIF